MRYAIFGDIHGNLEALEVNIAHAKGLSADLFISVGDVVGYGPQPSECIQRLHELKAHVVAGNHDWAAVGKIKLESFNPVAKASILWTRERLQAADFAWLKDLPLTLAFENFVVTHGTLHSPDLFFYMQSYYDAEKTFKIMEHPLCVCGHSHIPINFYYLNGKIEYDRRNIVTVPRNSKTIVNVGSVGQPRDGDSRTGYALYDDKTDELALYRLTYDLASVMGKILVSGLPEFNADRLKSGI